MITANVIKYSGNLWFCCLDSNNHLIACEWLFWNPNTPSVPLPDRLEVPTGHAMFGYWIKMSDVVVYALDGNENEDILSSIPK